ncbi:MAG: class I SAM-dependent methyltransferase [Candidatus Adiutrix sp.]|jgi:SAM-dependent methyltransferase|nr:class I SAM-dependent methyltransferase [Candidatus Adiutrix sp.]
MDEPSIELFERYWALDQTDQGDRASFWDQRAVSFNQHRESSGSKVYRRALMGRIAASCGLGPDSLALDIGCGPGHNAFLLAETGAQVEAFDFSPKMIELARQNAAHRNLTDRVNFRVLDWAGADLARLGWENKFDLSLASRTPAICDKETLVKMMAATRGFGLIITLTEQHSALQDGLRKVMSQTETLRPAGRSLYSAFNLLWLMGYYPEISYVEHNWESDMTLDEAAMVHSRYSDPEAVRDYLATQLKDGLIHEKVEAKIAVMRWEVGRGLRPSPAEITQGAAL